MTFDVAVRQHLPMLRGMAQRLAGQDADDLVQDALLRAMVAWRMFNDEQHGRRWLCVVLRSCFIDTCRRNARRSTLPFNVALVDDSAAAWADYMDAQRAFASVEPERRAVLELATAGYSHPEIAEMLGIAVGTSHSRLHRARAQVVEMLTHD